ncbi:helix-hairpin-helix domain-containing protein [Rummeliibacillus stabekisii]|nr:helix-hairpin-helix domain-containing protein [Rummeliibacillus stabekisii]
MPSEKERMCGLIPSFLKKNGKKFGIPIAIVIFFFTFIYFSKQSSTPPQDDLFSRAEKTNELNEPNTADHANGKSNSTSIEKPEIVASTSIMVDVKGAVKNPGVYKLDGDSRVIDAIKLAGGYAKNAQSKQINHAQKLQDEMVIYVPQTGEEVEEVLAIASNDKTAVQPSINTSSPSGGSQSTSNLVNLNTADESVLQTLNGIGPAKAQAILAYRTENGSFRTIEDLKNVTGIGDKTFESLQDQITVN